MDPETHLNATNGDVFSDITQCRRFIGRLLLLILSRLVIIFAVHKLSQSFLNLDPQTFVLLTIYRDTLKRNLARNILFLIILITLEGLL